MGGWHVAQTTDPAPAPREPRAARAAWLLGSGVGSRLLVLVSGLELRSTHESNSLANDLAVVWLLGLCADMTWLLRSALEVGGLAARKLLMYLVTQLRSNATRKFFGT